MVRPAVRAIFFDAGNTLIRMDYEAVARALAAHGVAVPAGTLGRAEWQARARLDEDLLGRPASTESPDTATRYLRYLLEAIGVRDEAVVAAMARWRRAHNPPFGLWTEPEPSAAAALALARRHGLRTGVISNSNGTVRRILDRVGLGGGLDFVLDSTEVRVEKPDPRIFRLALERAGVAAAEAVHVGDLYAVDVLGARAAGLRAVLLDPAGTRSERDCPRAADVLAAVRLVLATGDGGYSGSVTAG